MNTTLARLMFIAEYVGYVAAILLAAHAAVEAGQSLGLIADTATAIVEAGKRRP